jgi:hypothetical protein
MRIVQCRGTVDLVLRWVPLGVMFWRYQMLNPWLSLSLHTAQLALKMTRIMTGVAPNSTGSSYISESDDRAVQMRAAPNLQAPVAGVQERPMAATTHDSPRKSTTEYRVRKTASRAKVGHTPKEAAPRRAAAKQAVPKVAAPKRAAKRTAAASLARSKATRRSALKKK